MRLLLAIISLHCLTALAAGQQQSQPAGNQQVKQVMESFQPRGVMSDGSSPTPPSEALSTFEMHQGLEIDLVASEPDISQPLYLSWDSQGRMWVVEYRQYQFPAGLKVVEYDHHLRAVFDKTPLAPPNHVRGKDRITVFEDTNRDGNYDSHRTVVDGLNIATSVCIGNGGIWVLNPPYLLRYPDADRDAVLDGPPEVKLSGFGIQDTHAVANSLMWGPDGWIYGANGSTTTGEVFSRVTPATKFEGQCIWRFHPETDVFEIYAEGGGNTFSLDIDSKGRVFSGTNGGNTRGWYYPQGSYSRKNWGKHGPLTNPYAFGFFEAMRFEGDGRRFPQAFAIYEGGLPEMEEFNEAIIAPNAMQNLVWNSRRIPDGSTFRTVDETNLLNGQDRWFRPVYCGVGPDGAIYIADWYDTRLSHVSPTDDWHKTSGRVYRVRPTKVHPAFTEGDLAGKPAEALLILLAESKNKWMRQRATMELGWRKELANRVIERLRVLAVDHSCLEALWVLDMQNELTVPLAERLLQSESPDIRRFTVRIFGDRQVAIPGIEELAFRETDPEVRSQLAATAKRLPASAGIKIITSLLRSEDDSADPHIPLLCWWAVEEHSESFAKIAELCSAPDIVTAPVFKSVIAGRITQRYAMQNNAESLIRCEQLLQSCRDTSIRDEFLEGIFRAVDNQGSSSHLPPYLREQLSAYQDSLPGAKIAKDIVRRLPEAIIAGLKSLQDNQADLPLRIEIARALSGVEAAEGPLLKLATNGSLPPGLQRACIQSLEAYSQDTIAHRLIAAMDSQIASQYGIRDTCFRVLASRQSWARILLAQVASWRIKAKSIPPDVVQKLRAYQDSETRAQVAKLFGAVSAISNDEQASQINSLKLLIKAPGQERNLELGKRVFAKSCGSCHALFGEGQAIGPRLDNYDRGNLDFWLPAIVAPSLEIREGYQTYSALLESGRVLSGMVVSQTLETVTLRSLQSGNSDGPATDFIETKVARSEILELRAIKSSLMPEKILDQHTESEIRDLFAYLTSRLGPTTSTPSPTSTPAASRNGN